MKEEKERRCSALGNFWENNKRGLRSIRHWASASQVGYNTLNEYIRRKKDKNMLAETYEKLAMGASLLLKRDVRISDLLNEIEIIKDSQKERVADLYSFLPDREKEAFKIILEERIKSLFPRQS
jgi:hypothetical protein